MTTTEQILNKTNLNWTVSKRELYDPSGIATGYYGQFRDDTDACLGISSPQYLVSQNSDIIQLLENYFGSNLIADNVSGFPLKGGKRVHLKIKDRNLFEGTDAALSRHLLIKDSHDGSCPIILGTYDEVLVCSNGLTTMHKVNELRITHTKSMAAKLKSFDTAYSKLLGLNEKLKQQYETFMSTKVSMDLAITMLEQLNNCDLSMSEDEFKSMFSTRKWNIVQTQLECIELEFNRQGKTKWGLLNGITQYTTHRFGDKSTEELKESVIDGTAKIIASNAFDLIAAL